MKKYAENLHLNLYVLYKLQIEAKNSKKKNEAC